jgi:hypothetical protein
MDCSKTVQRVFQHASTIEREIYGGEIIGVSGEEAGNLPVELICGYEKGWTGEIYAGKQTAP